MSKKILIIGNSAAAYALAKKMSVGNEVYVAPGSDTIKEFATCLDIREDATVELLEFALENDIEIVIPISLKSLESDIVHLFTQNNLSVFAPSKGASKFIFDKSAVKKAMYKLRIPTPKFGIFEKQNMALDYIKNLKKPFVLKTNEKSSATILTSPNTAKNLLDSYFAQKNQKILIEDYTWGTPFAFYALTDGYKALPLGSSIMYKHSLEGEGGQLTNGMGSCVPNYKLSIENEYFLMDSVIYPFLEHLESNNNPYLGIIGVNGILLEDGNIQILGFEPFLHDCDCAAVLELVDTDLVELIQSCLVGSFSDEVEFIPQKEMFATSLVLSCKNKENNQNVISGLENIDESLLKSFYPNVVKNRYMEYEAKNGSVLVLTSFGRTVSSSTNNVYEEAENIEFKGLSYRKDICKPSRVTL